MIELIFKIFLVSLKISVNLRLDKVLLLEFLKNLFRCRKIEMTEKIVHEDEFY
jgi:hypothetical protein